MSTNRRVILVTIPLWNTKARQKHHYQHDTIKTSQVEVTKKKRVRFSYGASCKRQARVDRKNGLR